MAPGAMKSRVVVAVVVAVLAVLLPAPVSSQVLFPAPGCEDGNVRCPTLALAGRCDTEPTYMRSVCPFSCNICQPAGTTATTDTTATNTTTASSSTSTTTASSSTSTTTASPNNVTAGSAATTTTTSSPVVHSPEPVADPQDTTTNAAASPSRPTTAPSGAPRRSIVNPDFECGGPTTLGPARKRRQAPTDAGLQPEGQQGADATSPQEPGQKPIVHSNCGASVISDRFLLTAASCIDPEDPISSVRLGDLDLAQEGEKNSEPADYDIIDIIIPEAHNPRTRYNDIALLKTDRKIKFSENLFPYCVSSTPPAPGTVVIAAGYGYYNETHKSTHVLEGELEVLPITQCEERYLQQEEQRLKNAYPELLQKKGLLCAGSSESGVCEGDEGGPLFREDESGRRYLEGITSFTGSHCGEGVLPGVFTAVADYVGFIDSILYGQDNV